MDSAAGSAKKGRDRETQGILALRGKVLNTEKASPSKILANAEIQTIIEALGVGINHDYEEKDLKYDKVIIMTDADSDGHHKTTLLTTFFLRHMEGLVQGGHVYQALAPLYKITEKNNEKRYVWSKSELEEVLESEYKNKDVEVSRFKGLGGFRPL